MEFGILREGFGITHIGEYRVSTCEEVFWELDPLWEQIQACTGIELDAYGEARFQGEQLQALLAVGSGYPRASMSEAAQVLLAKILRIGAHALGAHKELSFFGA